MWLEFWLSCTSCFQFITLDLTECPSVWFGVHELWDRTSDVRELKSPNHWFTFIWLIFLGLSLGTSVSSFIRQGNKNRSLLEQDRKLKSMPMHLQSINYNRGGKTAQCWKDCLFNKWGWENWTTIYKIMKLDHPLTPSTKTSSEWIKNLNMRPDTMKLLEESRGRTCWHKSQQYLFWYISQNNGEKTQKAKINQ